jgi:hypothetical protein
MATGDTLAVWGAAAAIPPAANFATLDVRNGHLVLDFDDTTAESVHFTGVLPSHYGGNGVVAVLTWTVTSDGNSEHQVGWGARAERHPVGFDLDGDNFTSVVQAYAWLSTEPGAVQRTYMPLDETSAFVAGESFRLRIQRMAADDSAVGDAELLAVELREN